MHSRRLPLVIDALAYSGWLGAMETQPRTLVSPIALFIGLKKLPADAVPDSGVLRLHVGEQTDAIYRRQCTPG